MPMKKEIIIFVIQKFLFELYLPIMRKTIKMRERIISHSLRIVTKYALKDLSMPNMNYVLKNDFFFK